MKRVLLIGCLLAMCACDRVKFEQQIRDLPEGGTATDPKSGVTFTMHRKGAGTPDATGWVPATSTQPCGMHVKLPGPYNDFTQKVKATDGAMITIHVVGTRTIEGAKFTVTCTERSDNKVQPNFKEEVVDGLRADNPELKQRRVAFGGGEGIEYTMQNSRSAAIGRLGVVGTRAYQLIVEYPRSEDEYMPGVASTFFSSFEPR